MELIPVRTVHFTTLLLALASQQLPKSWDIYSGNYTQQYDMGINKHKGAVAIKQLHGLVVEGLRSFARFVNAENNP